MKKTKVIRVLSFIMALTLVFAMFSTPAYAISTRQMGAWVMSALTALSITWNSTLAPVGKGIDFFNDAYYITDTHTMENIPFTNDNVYDILDQSVISFSDGEVVIDGKHYQNIWLSHDAAEKFRVNAFDIKTAFDIASNSNGTYVSGQGYIDGTPIFNLNPDDPNYMLSPSITLSPLPAKEESAVYSLGNAFLSANTLTSGECVYSINYSDGTAYSGGIVSGPKNSCQYSYRINGQQRLNIRRSGSTGTSLSFGIPSEVVDLTPFDFAWTSGEIPAPGTILPSDNGLNTYVPSRPEEWTDNPTVQQTINNYNDFIENNPEFSPGVDVNLDKDTDILDKLGDLMDILGPLINLMHPEFGPKAEPTPPVPSDSIAETPWASLRNLLDRIIDKLSDIFSNQNLINSTIENLKQSMDSKLNIIADNTTNLKNNIQAYFNDLKNNLINKLDEIKNAIGDLVDKIVQGDSQWFKDVVDSIWNPFLRIFTVFKTHIGIWHYVVDWLQSISSPFTFFFGIITGLGTIYTGPIYASFAGILVIAIYRRFGR